MVLPRPFSPNSAVNFFHVTSPCAPKLRKHPQSRCLHLLNENIAAAHRCLNHNVCTWNLPTISNLYNSPICNAILSFSFYIPVEPSKALSITAGASPHGCQPASRMASPAFRMPLPGGTRHGRAGMDAGQGPPAGVAPGASSLPAVRFKTRHHRVHIARRAISRAGGEVTAISFRPSRAR